MSIRTLSSDFLEKRSLRLQSYKSCNHSCQSHCIYKQSDQKQVYLEVLYFLSSQYMEKRWKTYSSPTLNAGLAKRRPSIGGTFLAAAVVIGEQLRRRRTIGDHYPSAHKTGVRKGVFMY